MKYKAEKVQAVLFYQQNKIPQTLEALLNKMYKEKPDDLYGYMVSYTPERNNTESSDRLIQYGKGTGLGSGKKYGTSARILNLIQKHIRTN